MQTAHRFEPVCRLRAGRAACRPASGSSLCSSLRCRGQYSGDAHDVARRHGELDLLIDPPDAAKDCLSKSPHRVAPTEVLLDALADDLADSIPLVAGGPSVDRAAAASLGVLRYMGRDIACSARGDEVCGVVRPCPLQGSWDACPVPDRAWPRRPRARPCRRRGSPSLRRPVQSGSPSAHGPGNKGSRPCCGSCGRSARRHRCCSRACRCSCACLSSSPGHCVRRCQIQESGRPNRASAGNSSGSPRPGSAYRPPRSATARATPAYRLLHADGRSLHRPGCSGLGASLRRSA